MADQHCYLLDLPKELRLQIYDEVLTPHTIKLTSYDHPSVVNIAGDSLAVPQFYAVGYNKDATLTKHGALLRTCRQIYDEARPSLYRPSKLVLRPSRAGSQSEIERPFDVQSLQDNLRKVDDFDLDLITVASTAEDDKAHSRYLADAVIKGLKIQKARILVEGSFDDGERGKDDDRVLQDMTVILTSWAAVGRAVELTIVIGQEETGEEVRVWKRTGNGEWQVQSSYDDDGFDMVYDAGLCDRYFAVVKQVFSIDERGEVEDA